MAAGYGSPVLLACAAAVLLLSNLGNQYLWQDEAETALIAKTVLSHGLPLAYDGKNYFSQEEGRDYGRNYVHRWHPWLQFYVLAPFFGILGVSTFTARLPFALFGVGTVVLIYFMAMSMWRSRRAGAMAAVLLIVSVPFLLLCRQCRYYAPEMFFSVLGLYAYVRLLARRGHAALLFSASAILLFHTQSVYYAVLVASVILHCVIFRRDRMVIVLALSAGTAALNAPWAVFLAAAHRETTSNVPLARTTVQFAGQFVRMITAYVFPPLILALAVLVGVVGWARGQRVAWRESSELRNAVLLLLFVLIGLLAAALTSDYPFFRGIAPLVPVFCALMALILELAMRLHPTVGLVAFAGLIVWAPMKADYLYEITHDYDGPIEGIVKYLSKHGKETDVVAITYGDMPLKFYTKMRVVGGLTGEDLTPIKNAQWVIVRKHMITSYERRVRRYMQENLVGVRYTRIVLDGYPDIPWENREEPGQHHFRTVTNEDPVVIYKRVAE